jgi:hypothetical protein
MSERSGGTRIEWWRCRDLNPGPTCTNGACTIMFLSILTHLSERNQEEVMSDDAEILINRRVTRVSALLITSHLRSRSRERNAFVLKTNLGGEGVTKGRSKSCLHLGEATSAEKIAVCNYFCNKWVSGTVTIPDRSGRMRRITLSKPVIPKVLSWELMHRNH